ncbi:MAG: glycosyltransferase [Deltaproteobacteria bacterium]|nr:glycosyltransferase [Deltaproteobacteria bacterium]
MAYEGQPDPTRYASRGDAAGDAAGGAAGDAAGVAAQRVLMLLSSFQTGGMERQALSLALGLRQEGWDSLFAALDGQGPLREIIAAEGFSCFELGKAPGLDMGLPGRLARLARGQAVDLIHAHNWFAGAYAAGSRAFSRLPVVTTLHGLAHEIPFRRRLLRGIGARFSNQTVSVGETIREQAIARHGLNPARVTTICNGVDCAALAPVAGRREAARQCLGLAPEEWVFLFVGRLSPIKDLPSLLAAAAELAREGRAHRLVVAGGGEELPRLREQARQQGLEASTLFLGERNDIPALLAAADALVLPSLSEGISMAILEAMAAGLPVIACQVGGNPELVQPGRTGYLVPPRRPPELARAMARLMADPAAARALGEHARQICQARFSLEKMAQGYAAVYARALAGRG